MRGYIVIIAEKAKAANKIAYALSNGKAVKSYMGKVPYWSFTLNGERYVVAPAAGHLFSLHSEKRGFPIFEYEWVPIWVSDKRAKYTKAYYYALKRICQQAKYYINACDYDIEGSVIGYMIIKFFGDVSRAGRMKFSSLTVDELQESFRNLSKTLDWNMIESGICRHELDWIWGINVSRALMEAVRRVTGKRYILSAGRVQSPTLVHIVNRDVERKSYVTTPRFTIKVKVRIGRNIFNVEFEHGRVENVEEAREIVRTIKNIGKGVIVNVEKVKEAIQPPPPFNLGDLQAEAYRIYKMSPLETQKIAEDLYLDALISYPRTNSQKLPKTLNHMAILKKLSAIEKYEDLVGMLIFETDGKLVPREGRKEDPAHPAIHPTGVQPRRVNEKHMKIYDLIVRRYLACFSTPLIYYRLKVRIAIGKYKFKLSLKTIEDYGWLKYYPFIKEEIEALPEIKKGDTVEVVEAKYETTYSKPPQPYSKADVLKWMESVNIGTEATRARIIETLFERGYLKEVKGKVEVSDLGFSIAETLNGYFEELTSVNMTREFERLLESIRRGEVKREEVLAKAKKHVESLLIKYKDCISQVGLALAKSLKILKPTRPCIICGRESVDETLCKYHKLALDNILNNYKLWVKALNKLEFEDYLRKLYRNSNCGVWVREVSKAIIDGELKVRLPMNV